MTISALGNAFFVGRTAVGCQGNDFGFGENNDGIHGYHLLDPVRLKIKKYQCFQLKN